MRRRSAGPYGRALDAASVVDRKYSHHGRRVSGGPEVLTPRTPGQWWTGSTHTTDAVSVVDRKYSVVDRKYSRHGVRVVVLADARLGRVVAAILDERVSAAVTRTREALVVHLRVGNRETHDDVAVPAMDGVLAMHRRSFLVDAFYRMLDAHSALYHVTRMAPKAIVIAPIQEPMEVHCITHGGMTHSPGRHVTWYTAQCATPQVLQEGQEFWGHKGTGVVNQTVLFSFVSEPWNFSLD